MSCGKAAARKVVHARVLLLTDDSCGDQRPDDQIVACVLGSARGPSSVFADNWSPRASTPPVAELNPSAGQDQGGHRAAVDRTGLYRPPHRRCHWTLQLLADELVVLGLVDRIGIATVRRALKKTILSPGLSNPGASRRRPMPITFCGWRT